MNDSALAAAPSATDRHAALKTIAAQAGRGELTFPTSVDIALRVQLALDDPDCSLDQAARLIQAEPLLSARVVAMANSAVYNRPGRSVADVKSAVQRLGFRTVRSLAAAVITRQMAGKPAIPEHRGVAAKLWEHSAHMAALAHVIARRVTRQDPETAMFAGIVHDIGGFYLLSRAKDFPALLDVALTDWLIEGGDEAELQIGRAVLKALAVPAQAVEGIEALWGGFLQYPPSSLGDTLLLAEHLTPVRSPLHHPSAGVADGDRSDIDVAIGDETLREILAESAGEVRSLTEALRF